MSTNEEIYNTILMRDTCGNARTKVKNYFYYNVYNQKDFKYNSAYDELMLLDVLEGKKTQMEYLKRFIPFLILICIGALSWIIWIFMCYCSKKPKGCLKRYSRGNKSTRRICFFIYFGFSTVIIILLMISLIFLDFSKKDLNGTVCTLSMLRYEMMYGQSLLGKNEFKKPFWYGITTLSTNINNVGDLLTSLVTKCQTDILTDPNLIKTHNTINDKDENIFDITGRELKEDLENLYLKFKDEDISNANPMDTNAKTIPLYISNLGYKENNETYTGKILYDYQIHYEYLIETITDPILEICTDLTNMNSNSNPIQALNNFKDVISTLEDSMDLVTKYITNYLSKYLVNLKSFYFIFCFISLILMGTIVVALSILFSIYYIKPISALFSSIISMLYVMNFLMIFCLIFSGITGIFSIYFSNASDIIDCAYSTKNIGSNNPRIIPRTTSSSALTRCIRGDGNLLDQYLNDDMKNIIKTLKKINSIYIAVEDAYKRMHEDGNTVYKIFSSMEQVIKDFTLMKSEFSLTTSFEENGDGDINYMLNELNKYTMAGMKYQKTDCNGATYDIWTLRPSTSPFAQIVDEDKKINYYSIINPPSSSISYSSACALDSDKEPSFTTAQEGFNKYYLALRNYYNGNQNILTQILDGDTGKNHPGLITMENDFKNNFIDKMGTSIDKIKEFTDLFWDVFGNLVNDTTNYTGIEDAEKVDILGWTNCSVLGKDYNITMNTIKTIFVMDLQVVTYCSIIAEVLIITLYFIIISLANNIRDKDLEKTENKYDVESKKDDGEIFEIVENNRYKEKYDYEGELITISRAKPKKKDKLKPNYTSTSEGLNYNNEKTNDKTKDEDLNSVKKNLPQNIVTVPKFDIAENIEAIKNVDIRKLIDKQGKAVMHPIRISINSPLGVMEASDKYAHKYTYDIFEPFHEDESENNNSGIENGSFYQNNKGKKGKKNKKKKGKDKDKDSKQSSSFSF